MTWLAGPFDVPAGLALRVIGQGRRGVACRLDHPAVEHLPHPSRPDVSKRGAPPTGTRRGHRPAIPIPFRFTCETPRPVPAFGLTGV